MAKKNNRGGVIDDLFCFLAPLEQKNYKPYILKSFETHIFQCKNEAFFGDFCYF